MDSKLINSLLISIGACSVISCGGGASAPAPLPEVPPIVIPSSPDYWSAAVPDFTVTNDHPAIELIGDDVINLAVGETYEELGATATDPQDGDLTANINIVNTVNTDVSGDYFVRYQVQDANENKALEQVRIVRVYNTTPSTMSLRPVGASQSHLGYIESLPSNYAIDSNQQYGLLIFNHGDGANVEVSGGDAQQALENIISSNGPALMQQKGEWDTTLPLVTLSPQMGGIGDGNELTRLNAFIDYAVNTYRIDTSRIYITGWSQGGFLSLLYAAQYPERTAAAISISGGLPANPNEAPDDICQLENVPMWLFHGGSDNVVSANSSIRVVDYIEDNCQPTVLPKLTIFNGRDHNIHPFVYDLTAMQNNPNGIEANDSFDPFDVGIYQWMLQYYRN